MTCQMLALTVAVALYNHSVKLMGTPSAAPAQVSVNYNTEPALDNQAQKEATLCLGLCADTADV